MASSRSLGTLTIDLLIKMGAFTAGMSQAERIAADRARRIDRTFGKLKASIGGLFAGLGAGVLVRAIIQATSEAEKSLSLLDNAVKASGGSAGRTTQQLAGMASELQQVTTYSDEAVQGAEQLLLRFQSIQGLNFDNALKSSLDLAAALGTDLNSAAQLVGKALESPVRGMNQLARSGVILSDGQKNLIKQLTETGRKTEAQGLILDELKKRYGGAAEAARNNFGGALEGLKNALGDLLEAKGGVPELTSQINDLTKIVQNPNTVEGINNIITAVVRLLGVVVEAGSEFGTFGEVLARLAAAGGGNLGEFDRLQGEIKDLDRAINNSFMGRPLKFITKNTDELKAMRVEVQAQIDALTKAQGLVSRPAAAPATPGASITAPPSEEFLKLADRLNEQIALFGKVGEAAKIAYGIQSGELDELTSKEQEQVLALARRLDGLNASADAAKKAAEAAKEQAQAQEQLTQVFESQEASLLRQLVLTSDATELEQLRYEINSGGLQKLSAEQKGWLESLAKEVDVANQATKAEQDHQKVLDEGRELFESLRTPMENYQATIAHINDLLFAGAISHETYARAVIEAQDTLQEATKKSNEFLIEAAQGTQNVLADTLFGAMEGKIDNIGKAFVKMLQQLVAQALAAKLTEKLFGGGAAGGGLLSSLFGAIPGFANGGQFVVGGAGGVDSQLVSFWATPGEKVSIENQSSQDYSGTRAYSVQPAAVERGMPQISIHNYASGVSHKVERLSADEVRIIARDEVEKGSPGVIASQLANPNSRVSKSMSRNTTASRQRS